MLPTASQPACPAVALLPSPPRVSPGSSRPCLPQTRAFFRAALRPWKRPGASVFTLAPGVHVGRSFRMSRAWELWASPCSQNQQVLARLNSGGGGVGCPAGNDSPQKNSERAKAVPTAGSGSGGWVCTQGCCRARALSPHNGGISTCWWAGGHFEGRSACVMPPAASGLSPSLL